MTTTTKTFVKNMFSAKEKKRPVFVYYGCELTPQRAFISLDMRTGVVSADHEPETGGALPSSVSHGLVMRFPIRPDASGRDIDSCINMNLPDLQRLVDSGAEEFNGSDWVMTFDVDLYNELYNAIRDSV